LFILQKWICWSIQKSVSRNTRFASPQWLFASHRKRLLHNVPSGDTMQSNYTFLFPSPKSNFLNYLCDQEY
jgi:hypothetical protein